MKRKAAQLAKQKIAQEVARELAQQEDHPKAKKPREKKARTTVTTTASSKAQSNGDKVRKDGLDAQVLDELHRLGCEILPAGEVVAGLPPPLQQWANEIRFSSQPLADPGRGFSNVELRGGSALGDGHNSGARKAWEIGSAQDLTGQQVYFAVPVDCKNPAKPVVFIKHTDGTDGSIGADEEGEELLQLLKGLKQAEEEGEETNDTYDDFLHAVASDSKLPEYEDDDEHDADEDDEEDDDDDDYEEGGEE